MTTIATSVPLNTMLADLDESLRVLLKRELGGHGFNGVEIAFDAPAKEWSASLSTPTVNLFLYDVAEAQHLRPIEWEFEQRENGRFDVRPPLRVDASYAVTAWTREVEDEHRLLSQVLATLYAHSVLPDDVLAGALADPSQQRWPLKTKVAQERQDDKSDFWTAVGGQYKASIDYVVTLSCEPGTTRERGPEVRTQTVRTLPAEGGRAYVEEVHRIGGIVRDAEGEPIADAWVVLGDYGWTATDPNGRFRFNRLTAGSYTCRARAPDGTETSIEVEVPGEPVEIALGKATRSRSKKRK